MTHISILTHTHTLTNSQTRLDRQSQSQTQRPCTYKSAQPSSSLCLHLLLSPSLPAPSPSPSLTSIPQSLRLPLSSSCISLSHTHTHTDADCPVCGSAEPAFCPRPDSIQPTCLPVSSLPSLLQHVCTHTLSDIPRRANTHRNPNLIHSSAAAYTHIKKAQLFYFLYKQTMHIVWITTASSDPAVYTSMLGFSAPHTHVDTNADEQEHRQKPTQS